MTTPIQSTWNEAWGYFGTISRIEIGPAADPTEAWEIASRRIAEMTEASPEGVRDFLDSRHGRHFADEIANSLCTGAPLAAAIDAASCPLDGLADHPPHFPRRGYPRGLPYLTGWVTNFQILDEM